MSSRKPDPYAVDGGEAKTPVAGGGESSGEPAAPSAGAASARFSSHVDNGVHVIRFGRSDVLDAYYIEQLGDDIYRYVKPFDNPRVVVDLGNVNHLSSAALGMLVALKKVMDKKSGKLALAEVHGDLLQIFTLTKLNKLLKIHDSVAAAVRSLA